MIVAADDTVDFRSRERGSEGEKKILGTGGDAEQLEPVRARNSQESLLQNGCVPATTSVGYIAAIVLL